MSSWKALLLRIGEKCPEYGGIDDFKDHIESCYGAVRRELEHSGDDILLYLIQCAEQLPHKIPLYGTLVGLLNLEDEQFVSKVVEKTHSGLQAALISEDCNKIRILMRFLTVLMCCKVLQPSSIFGVFETLLASAATTLEARGDFYVRCIMSCLPWGGPELIEQVPEDVDRIMAGLEAYFSIRKHVSDTGLSVFEDLDETDNAVEEKDFLEDLWSRIQELSNAGWKLESVPRPHLSFEAQLVAGKSHDFGSINCPEQSNPSSVHSGISYGRQRHEAEFKYPQRIRRLNIFPASKVEDIQPIDRFVVEEYLLDVLLYLNGCRKECAAYMAGLPVPFRYEYLMAETIFSQLLLLPEPPFKPTYYTLVIIDLCKALPGAFPAVVAGAVRVLFEKIAELDMECRTRLILWFSHHLSNFQFIWPWEEWAHVLDLPKWAPQRVFVQEVLEREIRLSYYDKIKQSIEVAPALEQLLPPKGGPDFKYSGDDSGNETERELSLELSKMMRGRQTSREIIAWIEDSLLPAHSLEIVLSVVIQTILDSGSKSFTHLITILERYGQVISKICHDQERQIMLIGEVSSFWKNNSQMIALTIDRMMGYRLLSNLAIIRWVFSASNVSQFHICDHSWEILRNAVTKTYNRMSDLRKEITSVKKSVLLAEEAASKAQGELQAAESKLTLKDGEPVLGENPVRMKRIKSNANRAAEEALSVRESLEAKEALLARAVEENEALFLTLYKNFSSVLAEPLSLAFKEEVAPPSNQADEMAIDLEVSATMDLDDESSKPKTRKKSGDGYNINERDQWCLSTLGYLKAITRQYASEIWSYIEKIDAEVLTEDVHPLFRQAVYKGLRRPLDEMNMS